MSSFASCVRFVHTEFIAQILELIKHFVGDRMMRSRLLAEASTCAKYK